MTSTLPRASPLGPRVAAEVHSNTSALGTGGGRRHSSSLAVCSPKGRPVPGPGQCISPHFSLSTSNVCPCLHQPGEGHGIALINSGSSAPLRALQGDNCKATGDRREGLPILALQCDPLEGARAPSPLTGPLGSGLGSVSRVSVPQAQPRAEHAAPGPW